VQAGQVWCPVVVPGCDDLAGLHVALPVTSRIKRGPGGRLLRAPVPQPSDADLAEATAFVKSLATHDQIGGRAGAKATHPSRPTHRIETDAQGVRKLVRSRFSAV
jgi:hypothetical protein